MIGIIADFCTSETRDYMRARIAYVTEFYNMRTFDAANNALTHFLDMLRLNRGDNQGVRGIIPGLYLRLCRDQECYDFVKWWVQKHYESNYDWGDDTLPYLDLKNEDVMEDPELFCGRFVPCGMTISATLIKASPENRAVTEILTLREVVANHARPSRYP